MVQQKQESGMRELKRKIRTYARTVLGRQPAGRDLTVFLDDTFIVSYPRSGSTWLTFLMGNILCPDEPATFARIRERILDIGDHPDRHFRRVNRPRILKSHECFDPRYKRVIYIVRDPRDVAVSTYHFQIMKMKTSEEEPIEAYVSRWLNCNIGDYFAAFGTWEEHVLSWLAAREGMPGFLFLRYEDMKRNTQKELSKIACFLGIDASPEGLARAVELSSSKRMRQLETVVEQNWWRGRKPRPDVPFVRTAVAGGWRSALPKSSVVEIESAFGDVMHRLGYELSCAVPPPASADPVTAFTSGFGFSRQYPGTPRALAAG